MIEKIFVVPANPSVPVPKAAGSEERINPAGESVEHTVWIARRLRDGSLIPGTPPAARPIKPAK